MNLTNILLIIATCGIFWIGCVLSVLVFAILGVLRPFVLLNEELEADGFLSGLRTKNKPPEFKPQSSIIRENLIKMQPPTDEELEAIFNDTGRPYMTNPREKHQADPQGTQASEENG